MKKIYYEKVGRKYIPVREYDREFVDSVPKGTHIIMCYPGGKSTRYNIDPAYAPLIAASRVAEDAMATAIQRASEIRREENSQIPLTPEQKEAWEHLVKVFGERARYLSSSCARDVAESGMKAIQNEANKLLENPSVKLAYNHFMLVCELAKEHQNA